MGAQVYAIVGGVVVILGLLAWMLWLVRKAGRDAERSAALDRAVSDAQTAARIRDETRKLADADMDARLAKRLRNPKP